MLSCYTFPDGSGICEAVSSDPLDIWCDTVSPQEVREFVEVVNDRPYRFATGDVCDTQEAIIDIFCEGKIPLARENNAQAYLNMLERQVSIFKS